MIQKIDMLLFPFLYTFQIIIVIIKNETGKEGRVQTLLAARWAAPQAPETPRMGLTWKIDQQALLAERRCIIMEHQMLS